QLRLEVGGRRERASRRDEEQRGSWEPAPGERKTGGEKRQAEERGVHAGTAKHGCPQRGKGENSKGRADRPADHPAVKARGRGYHARQGVSGGKPTKTGATKNKDLRRRV